MTDGTQFETKSTWGKGEVLKLEIDPKSHSRTGGKQKLIKGRKQIQ